MTCNGDCRDCVYGKVENKYACRHTERVTCDGQCSKCTDSIVVYTSYVCTEKDRYREYTLNEVNL